MPQASPELRAQWPGEEREAIRYLKAKGYTLRRDWSWRKPTHYHKITEREGSAIDYLCDDWDFGGLFGD